MTIWTSLSVGCHPDLLVRGGTNGAPGPRPGRPARPVVSWARSSSMLSRVVWVSCTGDPVGHLRPERAGTDGARHLVGAVEAEDRLGVLQDLRGELVDRALEVGDVEPGVGAHPAAARGGVGLLVGPHVAWTGRSGRPGPPVRSENAATNSPPPRTGLPNSSLVVGQVEGEDVAVLRRRRCPRATGRRRRTPGGAARTRRRGSAGRPPGTRWWRSTSRRRCRR